MITGTHINYYFICHRKLWLFANGINMEHTSDLVKEGKLIHETSYKQRTERFTEVEIEGIRIDYYDPARKTIHETKKSGSNDLAQEWQLKYYMFILKKNGIGGVSGILEYPKQRETRKIELSGEDEKEIPEIVENTIQVIKNENCPPKIIKSKCKKCSYFDFCWSGEDEVS